MCILGVSIHVCRIDEREMIPLVELVSTRYIPVVLMIPFVACLPALLCIIDVYPLKHLRVVVVCTPKPTNGIYIMEERVEFWDIEVSADPMFNEICSVFVPCIELLFHVSKGLLIVR